MNAATWELTAVELPASRGQHVVVRRGERRVSYQEALDALEHDAAFASAMTAQLTGSPYVAARWETPPVTLGTRHRPFEFVLIEDRSLERPVDHDTFKSHFHPDQDVVIFDNLGRDARLVVPCPTQHTDSRAHLLAFLRTASAAQVQSLWRAIAAAMRERVDERPVWLSTAGGGVAYLHVRLDNHPKYYVHGPFRHWPGDGES
ncbi:MAG: hypothetical protein AAGF97_13690 [Planctomycetota bacterium]